MVRGADGAAAEADGGVGDGGIALMLKSFGAVSDRREPPARARISQVAARRTIKAAVIALIMGTLD